MRKPVALLLFALTVLTSGPLWAQGYAELQDEQQKLDRQNRDLQIEAFRARLQGNHQKNEELQKQIKELQKRRVEVMQGLGQLPR